MVGRNCEGHYRLVVQHKEKKLNVRHAQRGGITVIVVVVVIVFVVVIIQIIIIALLDHAPLASAAIDRKV